MIRFNLIEKFKVALNFKSKKLENVSRGGDGGQIVIISNEISGDGKFIADGGRGEIGGRGGGVSLLSNKNKFTGEVSAKGGDSNTNGRKGDKREKRENKNR